MEPNQIIEKILVALVVGLMGLVPVLLQSISNKRREKSRSSQLNKLQNELNFLEKWKNLSSSVQENENQITNNIIETSLKSILEQYQKLNEVKMKFEQDKAVKDIAQLSLFRRIFLMFLPQSFAGWILHSFFYFLVIFSIVMIISEIVDPLDSLGYLLLGTIIIFGIPALIIQRWAIKRMKKDTKKD